jgi:Transposase DDE domain
MLGSIQHLAEAIKLDLIEALPKQRKTQRNKLALLVATMLHARSANTMDLAAQIPLATERIDMRYQWASRFLSNSHVNIKEVMHPFISSILKQYCNKVLVFMIDQTHVSKIHEVLMVSLRIGQRAIPVSWCVRETQGNIGFEEQKNLLELLSIYLPEGVEVLLLGDRFFATASLIAYLKQKGWDYRLRVKGNLIVGYRTLETKAEKLEELGLTFLQDAVLTGFHEQTNIAVVREAGYENAWIIAMAKRPDFYKAFDYAMRWGIESMFSDFKTRGFGLEDSQMRYPDRLERLILIMAIAMIWAVLTGMWHLEHYPLPYEVKVKKPKKPIAA